jgi:hypothetical protein
MATTIRDGITRYREAYLQLNRAITKYFDINNISESDIKIKSICRWQEEDGSPPRYRLTGSGGEAAADEKSSSCMTNAQCAHGCK